MAFNCDYYNGLEMLQKRKGRSKLPPIQAFSTYKTTDNIVIGIFQGERGENPDLDFKVRVLFEGAENRPLLPPHSYWVVDLMLKCVKYNNEVKELAAYYLNFYDNCSPFKTHEERLNYQIQTLSYVKEKYSHIDDNNSLSLEYVAIIIELFCLNEKQTSTAYMFRDLLQKIYDYANGSANYIQLLEAAKPGNR